MIQIDIYMPKCCGDCPIRQIGLYRESHCGLEWCRIVDDHIDEEQGRPEYCRLMEVQNDER